MTTDGTKAHFAALKTKHRALRGGFPEMVSLRVHRALSWLGRAEQEAGDIDVRFILLWVGFNAAYAGDIGEDFESERGAFRQFFDRLVALDAGHRIYDLVWARFSQEIRLLLANRYVFAPFWSHQNGKEGAHDWQDKLASSGRRIAMALQQKDTGCILSILFDRLYILRNQLVHGGATWNGSTNRDQVRDGCTLLHGLLPIFIDLMMDNPKLDWGKPFYPVVD